MGRTIVANHEFDVAGATRRTLLPGRAIAAAHGNLPGLGAFLGHVLVVNRVRAGSQTSRRKSMVAVDPVPNRCVK